MCGIAGILGYEKNEQARYESIAGMISTLQHRGPDGWGYYLSPEIALGQTRLSIVDLSTGDQPFYTEESILVYNGEVFNYIELREELEKAGVRFKSKSDTEVIARAYEFYGEKCLGKLNGQFVFLLWNKKKKELFIARDRFGIRPLYILELNGSLYFSSEMKAFDTIPGFTREFDLKKLYQHALFWNTFGDATIYQNITSLAAGTYMVFSHGKPPKQSRYYEIGQDYSPNHLSYSEAKETFQSLLEDAVTLRLRSDVPVGAYLSGGIDSSVITYEIFKKTKKRYKTFSITFEDKEYDESSYQKEMIQSIGSEHFFLNITHEKIDRAFPDAIYHTERPVFRTAPVPLFLLSQAVRESDIRVVLTGEGADEILFGYDSYKELKMLDFWSVFPESKLRPLLIKKLYPHLDHYSNEKLYGLMKMYYEGFLGNYTNPLVSLNIRMHNNKIIENYFNKDLNIRSENEEIISEVEKFLPSNYSSWGILRRNQFLEMRTLLSGYLLSSQGDRMSLAHGIEGRYPFLDHRIVDFLFNIDDEYKMKGFTQKYLLRDTYSGHIPASILDRPKRPYMAPDLVSFFKDGEMTENTQFFMNEAIVKDYGVWDFSYISRFINKFKRGIPASIGYRDNMLMCFMLSSQMAMYWARHPKTFRLPQELLKVRMSEY